MKSCEALNSTLQPLPSAHPDGNSFATPNRFRQKIAAGFQGRRFRVSAIRRDFGHFCLILKQHCPFLWSWRDSNLRPYRCGRCVLTRCRVLRDQLNYKTTTLKPLRPIHADCNTFATPNTFKQNIASPISREAFAGFGNYRDF